MRNYFTLDGTDSRSFGVYISGQGTFDSSARSLDMIQVPGRNGDLIGLSTRLTNGVLTYKDCFIYANFNANIAALRAFLLSKTGYRRLVDTYHPDEYRMVAYKGPMQVNPNTRNSAGRFTLQFECMPQRFLISGETVVTKTSSGTITNPTLFASKPLLRVTTTRATASVLGVGSTNITLKRQGVTYIDCETGRAYNGATSYDAYVSLNTIDFPTLEPGSNGISLGTGISRVEITPRWWTV